MVTVSKKSRTPKRTRAVFSSILIAAVLAVALMPLANAQADTIPSASTPSTDVPSDATPKGDDTATPDDATPNGDDTATPGDVTPTPDEATPTNGDATTTTDAPADDTAPVVDAPVPPAPTDDGDGVDAAIENAAPHAGDNNEDGIADADQSNATSLPAAVDVDKNGALDDYVTIVSPAGTSLRGVTALEVPADSAPPEGAIFHYGLFDYEVQVANPGDPADVNFVLPEGPTASSVYMFQDGTWTEVTEHSDIDNDQNEVTVALEDGGVGDADHAADGVIDDPVGIAGQPNTITVTKATSPAGLSGSFTMTLAKCSGGSTGSTCSSPANETPSFSLSHGQSGTWGAIELNRNYRLTETVPSGWNTPTISCTPNVVVGGGGSSNVAVLRLTAANDDTTCTVTNTPQTGAITITKAVPSTDPTDFPFAATGPNSTPSFSLDDDGSNTNNPPTQLPSAITFNNLYRTQTYTFSELLPAGWVIDGNVSCSNTSSEQQIANGVSVLIDTGSTINCTFNNVKYAGTITVHKGGSRANPAGTDSSVNYAAGLENAAFEYRSSGSADPWVTLCTTGANGDCTSAAVPPGTYDVREKSAPLGWSILTNLTYGGDSSGVGNQSHAYLGTVAVGASGTSEAQVQYTNSAGDTENHRFINVKDDKPLPQNQCGIDIAMILDVSGSIGHAPSSPSIYKDAANQFITALDGTPTTLTRIVKFSDGATVVNPGNFPINLQTDAADAHTEINGVYSSVGGGTNWDAALKAMAGSGADVVVMVTDGNPTTWDGSPNGGGGNITLNDLAAGIASANSLKVESTIIAVGVGDPPAVTATNLAAISGPGRFFTSNLTTIKNELAALANQLCGSRIHVQKWVGGQLTDGWKFTGTATGANVSYPKGQVTGGGSNPPLPTGEMQINLDNVPVNGATAVSVAETVQPNYGVVGRKCQKVGYPSIADAQTAGNTSSLNIGTVQRNEDWYCTFVNQQNLGHIVIKKVGVGQGAGAAFGFSGSGTPFGSNGLTLTTQTGGSTETSQTYDVVANTGAGYTVSENPLPPGWAFTNVVCNDGDSTTNQGARSATFKVAAGEVVTCTWTNTKNGNVIIKKIGVGQGPGAAFGFSGSGTPFGSNGLTLTTQTGGSTETSTTYSVAPNTGAGYTVSENAPSAPWAFTNVACNDGDSTTDQATRGATFKVSAGETVTCTWTNTKGANVIVKKVGVGQGPGAAFGFSGSGTPFGSNGLTLTTQTGGSTETSTTYSVAPNTGAGYTVSENAPSAPWAFTNVACNDGDSTTDQASRGATFKVSAGETVTCTWTNTKGANIIVKKVGVGQGPGAAFNFSGSGTPFGPQGLALTTQAGGSTETSQTYSVAPNTGAGYSVSEDAPPPGWAFTSVVCDDGDSTTNAGARSATFKVAAGETVTCTWTNTKNANIIIKKTSVGLGAGASFAFSGSGTPFGSNGLSLTTQTGGSTETSQTYNVAPNTGAGYTVSENAPSALWLFTDVACNDGDSTTNQGNRSATFKVSAGETVTCTWTNTKNGNVIIKKTGVGQGPGAAFGFSGSGTPFGSNGLTLTTQTGGSTETSQTYSVAPNTGAGYSVSENAPASGWSFSNLVCDDGDSTTNLNNRSATFKVSAGETVTCTWTNTKGANIIVKKTGVGAGAGAAFDFSGSGTPFGPSGLTLTTQSGGSTESSQVYPVAPNTDTGYTVSENAPSAGWQFTDVVCDDGDSTTNQGNRSATFKVSAGETVTCTWTNTKNANIIIKKTGVGAGAGAAFDYSGSGTPFGSNGLTLTTQTGGSTETSQTYNVAPNTGAGYTVSENAPSAPWAFTNVVCDDGDSTTNQANRSATFKVSAGETVTCTWTNTKNANIIVKKTGVGAGAGAAFDFSGGGTPFGPAGLTLTTQTGGSTETSQTYNVAPNTGAGYTVSENALPAGWQFTDVVCDDGDSTTNQGARSATFKVSAGETVTCTWTNTKGANIIVKKTGVGAGAGAAFDFSAGGTPFGPADLTLTTQTGGSTETSQTYSVAPNTGAGYTVSEDAPSAPWAFTNVVCDDGDSTTNQANRSATFKVSAGETVTCTWTNTKGANIIVKKTGVGAGAGAAFDFSGSGTPFGPSGLTLTTQTGGSTETSQTYSVAPSTGAGYTVSEDALPSGWQFTAVACDNADSTTNQGARSATYKVAAGETVTCTWTNTKLGSITIVKDALPQAAQDFTFNTTNLGGPFTLDDDGDGTLSNTKQFPNLAPGTTYTVTEVPAVGWELVSLVCTGLGQGDTSAPSSGTSSTGTVSVAMKPGQVVSCTYTNQSPDLGVVKSDDPDPVTAGTQLTYTVVATNHGPADATGVVVTDTLDPNTTFVSTSLGADCTHAAGVVTCELGDMESGDSVEFTITVLVGPGAPVGDDALNNVVDVEGDQPDSNPENNHDEEPTSVISELDLAITKTDGGARPVAGQGSFTYTLSVDNLGPSDAQEDATVIDLLPAEVTFLSFGTLADGVICDPPVGRTITCTLDKDLLDVADDPVEIPIEVTVKAGTPSGDITNETVVTSPDDEAPCVVTEDDITCDPSDTNNHDGVVTSVTAIGGTSLDTAPPAAAAALAFTGSSSQMAALLGGLLLAAGAVVLVASRRRRKRAALGS